MKVYSKLLLLLAAMALVFGGLSFWIKQRSDEAVRLAKEELEVSAILIFDNIIELQRKGFETFALDYSWWQDLIDWIDTEGRPFEFIEEQFVQVPETYGSDFFAIYDLQGRRITGVLDTNVVPIDDSILPDQLDSAILERPNEQWMTSTYMETAQGLAEVMIAPVQPQDDEERVGPAHGYLAVGRFWDAEFILAMESLSGAAIAVNGARLHPDYHSDNWTGCIHFSREFADFEGVVRATLSVTKPLPVADRIVSQQRTGFWTLFSAALAAIFVIVAFVLLNVNYPLKKLSLAMQSGDTENLSKIPKFQLEFQRLAELIRENFQQRDQLEQEVAHRKRTEDELKHSRDLAESASKAKSRFLTNISHETRTPLHIISGYASLLKDSHLDEDQAQSVEHIHTSCDRLVKMLSDIIELSSIEAHEVSPQLSGVELQEFLYELVVAAQSLAVYKPIKIETDFCADCPKYILSDYARLRHVLMYLIDNAVKFTQEGSITIRVCCDRLEDGMKVRFEVEDSGVGIAEDKIELVFDAFFQADDSDSRVHEGGGLGLAVAKGIANLLDASIGVRSVPKEGSVFTLSLVQTDAEMKAAAEMVKTGVNLDA